MTYIVLDPCIDVCDKRCVQECPVDCIYEGARMLYIHPNECISCGACEPVCPTEAIRHDSQVPAEWTHFADAARRFFDQLGSPGSSVGLGVQPFDPDWIKALPPRRQANA